MGGGERCSTLLTGTRRGSAVYTPFTFFHIVILDASISRAKIVAEKSEPERLRVVRVPSSVDATKPVTMTIGAAVAQSTLIIAFCSGCSNHSFTRSAVTSHRGSTPTTCHGHGRKTWKTG